MVFLFFVILRVNKFASWSWSDSKCAEASVGNNVVPRPSVTSWAILGRSTKSFTKKWKKKTHHRQQQWIWQGDHNIGQTARTGVYWRKQWITSFLWCRSWRSQLDGRNEGLETIGSICSCAQMIFPEPALPLSSELLLLCPMPFVSFGHVALGTECHVTRNMCKRGGVRRVYFGTISCPPLRSLFVMAAVYDIPIFAVRKSEFTCVNQRTDNETKEDFRDYMRWL